MEARRTYLVLGLIGGLWGTEACGGTVTRTGASCQEGTVRECPCPSGSVGVQACGSDGSTWESCECGDAGPANGGTTGGDDATSGSGGNAAVSSGGSPATDNRPPVSTGGSPATGGQSSCLEDTRPACGDDLLIDDGEGSAYDICPDDGKIGYWYALADEASRSGAYGLVRNDGVIRMYGSGYDEWVVLGVLISSCNTATPYDASAYSGVQVQLHGVTGITGSEGAGDWIPMVVWTTDTASAEQGGTCAAIGSQQCNGHFRADIYLRTGEWMAPVVVWSDLAQPDWAVPAPFNPAHLLRIEFRIDFTRTGGTPGADFDINIANLTFIR